jgi:hypothetical protein
MAPHHVLGDRRLSHFEAELQKFAMNARRAPERVISAHLADERPQLRVDLRAPSPFAGLPTPVATKPGSMPPNQRLRTQDVERLRYRGKQAIKLDEEPSVRIRQTNSAAALSV